MKSRFGQVFAKVSGIAVLGLAALPAISLTQMAHAAPTAGPVRIQVGDLDLSQPQDARLFKARIDAAGKATCLADHSWRRLGAISPRACRLDFNDAVHADLTPAQTRALRATGG